MMLGFGDSGNQIHNWTSGAKTKGTLGPNDTDKMVKLCVVAHTCNPSSTWEVEADRVAGSRSAWVTETLHQKARETSNWRTLPLHSRYLLSHQGLGFSIPVKAEQRLPQASHLIFCEQEKMTRYLPFLHQGKQFRVLYNQKDGILENNTS